MIKLLLLLVQSLLTSKLCMLAPGVLMVPDPPVVNPGAAVLKLEKADGTSWLLPTASLTGRMS